MNVIEPLMTLAQHVREAHRESVSLWAGCGPASLEVRTGLPIPNDALDTMRVLVLRRPIVWGLEAVRRVAAPTPSPSSPAPEIQTRWPAKSSSSSLRLTAVPTPRRSAPGGCRPKRRLVWFWFTSRFRGSASIRLPSPRIRGSRRCRAPHLRCRSPIEIPAANRDWGRPWRCVL